MGAFTLPMETVVVCAGFGKLATAVCEDGAAPVAMAGETAPAPVIKMDMTWPDLAEETTAPLASTASTAPLAKKIPGAAAAIEIDCDATCPLLFSVTVALLPTGTS